MKKRDELTDPLSCMSKARDEEMTFVLLARDECAPAAIRAWCIYRIQKGKNKSDDPQIIDAMNCADEMERQRSETKAGA